VNNTYCDQRCREFYLSETWLSRGIDAVPAYINIHQKHDQIMYLVTELSVLSA
jgi:hypothetical protein